MPGNATQAVPPADPPEGPPAEPHRTDPNPPESPALQALGDRSVLEWLDALPQGALVLDPEGVIVHCNEAVNDLLGGNARQRLIGHRLDEISGGMRSPEQRDELWRTVLEGNRWAGEVWVTNSEGESVPLTATRCPILDDHRQVVGVLSLAVDRRSEVMAQRALEASEERFRALVQHSTDVAIIFSEDGEVLYASPSVEAVSGYTPDQLVGTKAWDYHHPDDVEADMAETAEALMRGTPLTREWRLVRADGTWGWFEFTLTDLRHEAAIGGVVGNFRDVTARHAIDTALRESEEIFRRTVEQSSDAFVAVDAHDVITEWNPAASKMFGWAREEALGRPLHELLLPDQSRSLYLRGFRRALQGGSRRFVESAFEMTCVDRGGRHLHVEICVVHVEAGGRSQFQAFVRDISDRKAIEARLTEQALTDQLTQLPNRALLRDRLTRAVGRLGRTRSNLAVMFLDVDRFKLINDGLGHDAGDEFLVEVGTRIQGSIRGSDTVARYGGDEFVVIAEDVAAAFEPVHIARRVLDAVSAPLTVNGRALIPSISIGIVITSSSDARPDDLVRDADVAMYRAKERGGSCAVVFDDAMGRRALGRFELEGDLRRALDHGELRVHYQPIVRLNGEIDALEALVRWQHPERGLVLPGDFVPLAEETGLVGTLGLQVLDESIGQVADWRQRLAPQLRLAVNISTRQLADEAFPSAVAEILDRYRLEPAALCLEITETSLITEPEVAMASLRQLTDLGLRIGVDDFGTGYSSLVYLRRFPVQILKLDQLFVAGLTTSRDDLVIAESVITLAHSLGMTAVAEGVETRQQRDILQGLGCELAQGWLWAKAQPGSGIETMLSSNPPKLAALER